MLRFRFQQHLAGVMFCVALVLVAIAAMNTQNNLLFWVLGVLVAVLLASALLSKHAMRAIQVRRIDPQHGAVGEPLVVRYAVTNRSRVLPVFNVHIEERVRRHWLNFFRIGQPLALDGSGSTEWRALAAPVGGWVMHLGPRETVHGEAIFWPTRRGRIAFDQLRCWTSFPFGITRAGRRFSQPQHTVIYPMLYELRPGLLRTIMPKSLMGSNISQHAGMGDDYYGTREYKPGDGMRHIAWKLTARADELITIERTAPSPSKLRVILDLTVPTQRLHVEPHGVDKARELEESAISLAASVLHAANLEGFEIGLTVLGVSAQPIAVRRNRWHFNKIMAALAEIDLDGPRSLPPVQTVRDAERCALVVIAPDRVQPLAGREDAWHLSARQLHTLAVRTIGWNAAGQSQSAVSTGAGSSRQRQTGVKATVSEAAA